MCSKVRFEGDGVGEGVGAGVGVGVGVGVVLPPVGGAPLEPPPPHAASNTARIGATVFVSLKIASPYEIRCLCQSWLSGGCYSGNSGVQISTEIGHG